MRKWYVVVVGVALVLAVGLYVVFSPSQSQRFASQVAKAFEAGDLETAKLRLEEWAAVTGDALDRSAIMSLHMAVSIAQVVRDAQLLVEYEGLNLMLSDPEGTEGGFSAYSETLQHLEEQLRRDQDEALVTAKAYHASYYQGGLRLRSPVAGTLDLVQGEEALNEAFRALVAGDATSEEQAVFHASVAREALGAVLRLVIAQPEGQSADKISLSGMFDFAELWWLIAAHSTDAYFSETALGIVLDETQNKPDHPARQRAQEALREVRRLG